MNCQKKDMKKGKEKQKKGFIALTSVTILSAVFIIIFVGMFFVSTEQILRGLNEEEGIRALSLTGSCAELSLKRLQSDIDYEGDETEEFSDGTCEIKEIQSHGEYQKIIYTKGNTDRQGHVKRTEILLDVENHPQLEIESWR